METSAQSRSKHAPLSPSAAHRWMNCPAAPRLEADAPDTPSPFAEEGTLAHALCAKRLKDRLGMDTAKEQEEIDTLWPQYGTDEMLAHAEDYAERVWDDYEETLAADSRARLMVEQRFELRSIPDCYGTADAVIVGGGKLHVYDFKYGQGVAVEATGNPQMRIYALGVLSDIDIDFDIEAVEMSIIQPRKRNYASELLPVGGLLQWADEVLTPAVRLARQGRFKAPGEWCRFCMVRNSCRALAAHCLTAATADAELLTPEQIAADVLPALDTVKSWASGMEAELVRRAMDGTRYPGWKVVRGRGRRVITDPGKTAEALAANGVEAAKIWKPRELQTLTALEKAVGKKQFADLCGEFVSTKEGNPTLVPDSDKRQDIAADASVFDAVKDTE